MVSPKATLESARPRKLAAKINDAFLMGCSYDWDKGECTHLSEPSALKQHSMQY